MKSHDNKTRKPVKDPDLKTLTYFLRVAGLTVPFVGLLGLYIGYVHWGLAGAMAGVAIAVMTGLAVSTMVFFFLNALGGAAGNLIFGRREAVWTVREQVQGILSQARFNRQNKDYPAALSFVNRVLEKDPDFAEALLLKAQILWEGFGQSHAALQFLEKALSLENKNQTVQNQASLLQNEMNTLKPPADDMSIPIGIKIGLASRKSFITKKLNHESMQDLKARAQATPMASWAIYVAMVFGLFLVCVLLSLGRQIQNADHASTAMNQAIESTLKKTRLQAIKIQEVEKSVQAITSELSRMDSGLNKKK